MAKALEDLLPDEITDGVIVVKDEHGLQLRKIKVCEASHPVPDARGVKGTQEILSLVEKAGKRDLVICLISGGGSALLIAPVQDISLEDKQNATKRLLACGATIHEFNTVRKHLSRAKGGRLAQMASPATVTSLILSDVVGDDLDVIASGPTVPDSSTFHDAVRILKGYGIWDQLTPSVRNHLEKGIAGQIEDTPKPDHAAFQRCSQVLVGTNLQALKAAGREAQRLGYRPLILSSKVEGEAREVAKFYAAIAKEVLESALPMEPPVCVLAGGETTVTLQGDGRGGRNQEFALASALAIGELDNIIVLSGGTDGTDGPTDAAGAIADGTSVARALKKSLDPKDYLQRNDSYSFFQKLDDLVITGPTRTNVMDLYMLLVGSGK
jgi:hydroxypyruvate reductase